MDPKQNPGSSARKVHKMFVTVITYHDDGSCAVRTLQCNGKRLTEIKLPGGSEISQTEFQTVPNRLKFFLIKNNLNFNDNGNAKSESKTGQGRDKHPSQQ